MMRLTKHNERSCSQRRIGGQSCVSLAVKQSSKKARLSRSGDLQLCKETSRLRCAFSIIWIRWPFCLVTAPTPKKLWDQKQNTFMKQKKLLKRNERNVVRRFRWWREWKNVSSLTYTGNAIILSETRIEACKNEFAELSEERMRLYGLHVSLDV